jgi:hypothetical protein
VRNICKEYFGISCKVSLITASELTDNDIAPKGTTYFSIKLSLSEVKLEKVLNSLKYIISSNVILHDIDITQDIPYITHREQVKEHILKKGIEQKLIIDDLSKVGRNCISFYNKDPSDKESLLRIKVYNKFVQMLESCDVRTTLGSRIHNLFVDPSRSMKNIFELTKYTGLTRIEIKFYGSSIYDVNYYVNRFNYIKDRYLQGCQFYKVSFENQWKQLVNNIYKDHVIMIYLTEEKMFAYCHWWNSITRKMQGGYKKITSNDNLETLIANYSFSGMNTKLIIVNSEGQVHKEYKREESSNVTITLIPGPYGGLYPQIPAELDPEDVGLVEYRRICIGWPKNRIRAESHPLTQIIEISDSEELEEITNCSGYKAAYKVLKPYSVYQAIAKGQLDWRGEQHLFLNVLEDNRILLKIRCGKQLYILMKDEVKRTFFRTQNLTAGGRDINVVLERPSHLYYESSDEQTQDEERSLNSDDNQQDEETPMESLIDRMKRLMRE